MIFLIFPFNGSINLTYIVKKDKGKVLPSCIAEEFERYEAVGWVYPMPSKDQGIPNISKFYPHHHHLLKNVTNPCTNH